MKKKLTAIGLTLATALGGWVVWNRKSPAPVEPVKSIIVSTPTPTPEPEPFETTKSRLVAQSIQSAQVETTWDWPPGGYMEIPANVYRNTESFTPAVTYVTGVENYNGYVPCQGAKGAPDHVPCAYVFYDQQVRWILLGACASGQRPGNPVQCHCVSGMAGNSGKCK